MRVLHVVPSLSQAYGGITTVVRQLSAALVKEGASVDVAATNDDGGKPLVVPLGVPIDENQVKVFYFAHQGAGSFAFSRNLTQWLWRNIDNYDLVHLHSIFSYPTLVASRVARRKNVPYAVTPHGMVEPWCLKYKAWKKAPYLKFVELKTLARAAALHALVAEEQQHLRDLELATPTFVIPNGIDLSEFSLFPPRQVFESLYPKVIGKRIVLFMGRIDPKKGVDLLVKAFAQAASGTSELCLVIAGPDLIGYRAQIEKIIAEMNFQARVVFTGMISGNVKLAALKAADVFVLPSHSEGFSMAILESLAAACPVIITEACNFSEVARFRAGKVVAPNVEQLTQALRDVLSDEAERMAMGERGRHLIEQQYDWSVIARRMLQVYDDILHGQHLSVAWAAQKSLGTLSQPHA